MIVHEFSQLPLTKRQSEKTYFSFATISPAFTCCPSET